jgi:hypothetical protein
VGEEQGPAAPAAAPRGLIRQLRADPNHAPETFVLFAVDRLGDGALDFADRARRADPGLTPAELSARVHDRTVGLARIDGAVAGCPFLLALVPAYVAMLWEQARMALRIGALYGTEARGDEWAAELLWLRGAQPSLEAARTDVESIGRRRPKHERRGLRAWYELGYRLLIMAGFLSAPDPGAPKTPLWRRTIGLTVAGVLWAITWIFPATFMLAMAFAGVSSTNSLASRARTYYGGGDALEVEAAREPASLRTKIARGILLALSIGVPIGALVISAHFRPAGIEWYWVLITLAGISLVLGLSAAAARS